MKELKHIPLDNVVAALQYLYINIFAYCVWMFCTCTYFFFMFKFVKVIVLGQEGTSASWQLNPLLLENKIYYRYSGSARKSVSDQIVPQKYPWNKNLFHITSSFWEQ